MQLDELKGKPDQSLSLILLKFSGIEKTQLISNTCFHIWKNISQANYQYQIIRPTVSNIRNVRLIATKHYHNGLTIERDQTYKDFAYIPHKQIHLEDNYKKYLFESRLGSFHKEILKI